jgi:hypothetical protein
VNGTAYWPVGADHTENLRPLATDEELAKRLWDWTEGILLKHDS